MLDLVEAYLLVAVQLFQQLDVPPVAALEMKSNKYKNKWRVGILIWVNKSPLIARKQETLKHQKDKVYIQGFKLRFTLADTRIPLLL